MAQLAAALFLALLAPPVGVTRNSVEICSLALSEACHLFRASDLDPTIRNPNNAGQVAIVDPESGALVAPTGEQLDELATELAFEEKQLAEAAPQVTILPDGTVRLHFPAGFRTQLQARRRDPQR
ncbi:MAG TPA: hypothetical protein VGV61_12260 [Thermoanaerobaculia bacterium]|jgi:hypothetical protein|nr:hypothetical protein [Thermoanaerobaculia bacterium]